MNSLSRLGSTAVALVLGISVLGGCNRQSPSGAGTASSSGASGAAGNSGTSPMRSSGSSGAAGAAGTAMSDIALTARVKAAFVADSDLQSTAISVDATNGEVTLNGALANQAQIERAAKVAGAVGGVRGVRNQLSVQR
jgi:hyperosmotically inducible protein